MRHAVTSDKKSLEELYEYFKKVTYEAFRFLIDDYDFKLVRTESLWECVIEYWNKTTCVRVTCEPYSHVWVEIGWLYRTPEETTMAEPLSLEFLLEIRCPEKGVKQKKYPTREDLDEALYTYAALLREYGHDILTGDFQIYPQLKVLAQEATDRYFAQFSPKKGRQR